MLAISDQEPFASLTTIELEEEILRESIRYGRHGEAVARFLRAAGQLGLELSRSRGETMSVLLAHHLGYGREPGEGCPAGRARAFARMKRTRLLGELGLPEEPWLVRVLGRVCFADLLLPGDLRSLCAALEDRKARAWLAHLETISPASLRVLGDPERRRAATFSLLVELGTGARDCEEPTRSHEHILRVLDSVIGLIRLLYPGQRLPRIRGIDELLKTHRDLLVRHSAWQNLPARYAPFPEPPFPGTDTIIPIRSAQDLGREGAECGNCIGSHYLSMIGGCNYAYRVLEPERATLLLSKRNDQWILDEARGRNDLPPTRETLMRVLAWLLRENQRLRSKSETIELLTGRQRDPGPQDSGPQASGPQAPANLDAVCDKLLHKMSRNMPAGLDEPHEGSDGESASLECGLGDGACNGATAAGNGAAVEGNGATAAGNGAAAAGNGATAAGNGATAAGNGATAAGNGATAEGKGAARELPLVRIRKALQQAFESIEALHHHMDPPKSSSQHFWHNLRRCHLPDLTVEPPYPPREPGLALVDADHPDLARDYASLAALLFARRGNPTLLADPAALASRQVQRLLGLWSGVPRANLARASLSIANWRDLTDVARVLDELPISVNDSRLTGLPSLELLIRQWRADLQLHPTNTSAPASRAAHSPACHSASSSGTLPGASLLLTSPCTAAAAPSSFAGPRFASVVSNPVAFDKDRPPPLPVVLVVGAEKLLPIGETAGKQLSDALDEAAWIARECRCFLIFYCGSILPESLVKAETASQVEPISSIDEAQRHLLSQGVDVRLSLRHDPQLRLMPRERSMIYLHTSAWSRTYESLGAGKAVWQSDTGVLLEDPPPRFGGSVGL